MHSIESLICMPYYIGSTLYTIKKVFYPKLFINNSEIERVDSFNFSWLQLNHNLYCAKHVNYISLKLSKIIGII